MKGKYKVDSKKNIYVLGKKDIDFEAQVLIKEYYPNGLESPCEIPVDLIIDAMGVELQYRRLSLHKEILGGCIFEKGKIPVYDSNGIKNYEIFEVNTIIINSDLADDDDIRYSSTIGHELGHYVTQGDFYINNDNQLSLFEINNDNAILCKRESSSFDILSRKHKKLESKEEWMEWQANYFSSAILVPKITLMNYLKPYFEKLKNKHNKYILNNLDSDELLELLNDLTNKFKVSFELMLYRLKNLELLQNHEIREEMTLWQ